MSTLDDFGGPYSEDYPENELDIYIYICIYMYMYIYNIYIYIILKRGTTFTSLAAARTLKREGMQMSTDKSCQLQMEKSLPIALVGQ